MPSTEAYRCQPKSEIRHRTSEIRHPTFDIRDPTFDIRHPRFDIRHLTFEIRVRFERKQCALSAIDKHNFMVSNENIEIVNNYTYLRVKVSANGNFTNHKENLTEKTEILFCRLSLSRFSKITNSYHQQTVQYTIFPNFNVLLRSLGNL